VEACRHKCREPNVRIQATEKRANGQKKTLNESGMLENCHIFFIFHNLFIPGHITLTIFKNTLP
jgi:hypothetical protein